MPKHSQKTPYRPYHHKEIESYWQKRWADDKIYQISDSDPKPKWYELTMFPYTSGDIHIGHWYAMAPSDAHARFKRMQGFNVMHPMGFDAFGLPAENAAIKNGTHPKKYTESNISKMRKQLRTMGSMYDWHREIITSDPEYYRWNQWIFLKLYETGLAYRSFAPVNWCPTDNTVLANEQVVGEGLCERCSTPVTRRELNQWFFKITEYADELLNYSQLQWPEKINIMQSNWIGRSEGVQIKFDISRYGLQEKNLTSFTTRVDTIFGVTFVALAPEHPLVPTLTTPERKKDVDAYIETTRRQTEVQRLSTDKGKTGVFTGAYCTNQLNGEQVPILIADYVLMTYGTGVVMGVPAHDPRDFDFAKQLSLPIKIVIAPPNWDGSDFEEAYIHQGTQINSNQFDKLPSEEGVKLITNHIEENGWGTRKIEYRMRDWLISRQRYWGTPIPIVHCDHCGIVPVPEKNLPVLLPDKAEFKPTGKSPLERHLEFVNTNCPQCNRDAKRETDTMDTFVDSSWYQFRFTSPGYTKGPFDPLAIENWSPVDQYTGGAEHAVMHLLYARFLTKALRDIGLLKFNEPFIRLFNQGHILADHQKMSKSRGNVIAPDDYVRRVGADAIRCYLMFLGPWNQGGDWSDSGLNGITRWLNRVWDLAQHNPQILENATRDNETKSSFIRSVNKTIQRVVEDMEKFKFNTALAALMELTNSMNQTWRKKGVTPEIWEDSIEKLLLMMAPMAPHISEELWKATGHPYSIHKQSVPQWDTKLSSDEFFTLVVQVNGRLRDKIEVPASTTEAQAKKIAMSSIPTQKHISSKTISNIIYVPGKLINIVTR